MTTISGRAAAALWVSFFLLYSGLSLTLHLRVPRLFARLDLVFDADVPSRIIDLTRVPSPRSVSENLGRGGGWAPPLVQTALALVIVLQAWANAGLSPRRRLRQTR